MSSSIRRRWMSTARMPASVFCVCDVEAGVAEVDVLGCRAGRALLHAVPSRPTAPRFRAEPHRAGTRTTSAPTSSLLLSIALGRTGTPVSSLSGPMKGPDAPPMTRGVSIVGNRNARVCRDFPSGRSRTRTWDLFLISSASRSARKGLLAGPLRLLRGGSGPPQIVGICVRFIVRGDDRAGHGGMSDGERHR